MLDAIVITNNAYNRSYADVVNAQTLGLGFKNGRVGKWYPSGKTYNVQLGETAGTWRDLSSGAWLSPNFVPYANISNAAGVAKNGLLYANCTAKLKFSAMSSHCSAKGMRVITSSEAYYWDKTNGVPSCTADTTKGNETGTSSGGNTWSNNHAYLGMGGTYSWWVRCVR